MARKKRRKHVESQPEQLDRGTVETRRRLTPDPLEDKNLEPHRVAAGLALRMALEEGLGAKGLDVVRIGMSAGASHSYDAPLPLERLLIAREWLDRWRSACRRRDMHPVFAEQFVVGNSLRQIAAHHVLPRRRVGQLVHETLDVYAEMRGFLPRRSPIRVSEVESFVAPETDDVETADWTLPEKARLRRRNLA